MAEIFKSNGNAADNDRTLIMEQESNISEACISGGGLTNLTVIGNVEETSEHINLCNSAYKNLLSKDASAISKIKDEYDKLDKEISNCMGVE